MCVPHTLGTKERDRAENDDDDGEETGGGRDWKTLRMCWQNECHLADAPARESEKLADDSAKERERAQRYTHIQKVVPVLPVVLPTCQ